MKGTQKKKEDTHQDRAAVVSEILSVPMVRMHPIGAGGNSRVYRVQTGDTTVVAKWYADHRQDRRRRQHAEWTFLKFAESNGLKTVPHALFRDGTHGVTVMSWLEGRPLTGSPRAEQVAAAARFVVDLNSARVAGIGDLPLAAEGGFSFFDHSNILSERLERLCGNAQLPDEAIDLIEGITQCHEIWRERVAGASTVLTSGLTEAERCISPSDFGFHNVLFDNEGRALFHDFEYAGWDDPAKLVCDFFWQPAVPVGEVYREEFTRTVLSHSFMKAEHRERIKLLDPLFGLRWCCIFLNPFFPDWVQHHKRTGSKRDISAIQHGRLNRARVNLDEIRSRLSLL